MTAPTSAASSTVGPTLRLASLLALVTVATVFGIDGTLPAMPAIGAAFGATKEAVQLTLSAFMLGVAAGQLVHGPLSDRFGRRPTILAGVAVTAAAAAGCAISPSIETLTVFRFLHGVGAATGWIVSRAVVRDRFERAHAARVISITMVFHGVAPITASVLGGYLTVWFGWFAVFAFIAVYSAIVLAVYAVLFRETMERTDGTALRLVPMLRNFARISRSAAFWGYAGCASAAYGMLFAFLGVSSHIIITLFGNSETDFGYMIAISMAGSVSGMFAGAWLVGRLGVDRLLRLGIALSVAFGFLIAALAWAGIHHWLAVVGPMALCLFAFSLIFPQSLAGALQPFPHFAGTASSLIGFIQQTVGAGTGMAVAAMTGTSQSAMANAILFWALFGLAVYWLLVRRHRTV